jgi:hypothetical protein
MVVATGLTKSVMEFLTVKMGLMKLIVSKWYTNLAEKHGVRLSPLVCRP